MHHSFTLKKDIYVFVSIFVSRKLQFNNTDKSQGQTEKPHVPSVYCQRFDSFRSHLDCTERMLRVRVAGHHGVSNRTI